MEYYTSSNSTTPKKTVIILHDLYFTGKFCENYEKFWSVNNYQVICPSLPGWGYSDINNGTIQHYDDDIVQLLSHLEVKEFSLVGVRLGALYATFLAKSPTLNNQIKQLGLISPLRPLINSLNEIIDMFEGVEANSEESTAHQIITTRGIAHLFGYLSGSRIKEGNLDFMKASTTDDYNALMKLKEKDFIIKELKRSIERSWKILALYLRWISFPWDCQIMNSFDGFITSNTLDETVGSSHQKFMAKCNPAMRYTEYKQSHYEIYTNFERILKQNLKN